MNSSDPFVLIRGGGDLGSGAAYRLFRCGIPVLITDLPYPLCVRRLVCFSEAIPRGRMMVDDLSAQRVDHSDDMWRIFQAGEIPVMADEDNLVSSSLHPLALVDARMMKTESDTKLTMAPLVIGLGPGFTAGVNCHAVVETNRGGNLGRVFWDGRAEENTGIPEKVGHYQAERVLRAPAAGLFHPLVEIGDHVAAGQVLFDVAGVNVRAIFKGVVRGLLAPGTRVSLNMKVGDIDPRDDPRLCYQISDKALSVGGGVVEAILTRPEIRNKLLCRV